jgi:hypothetical protein
MVNFDYSETHSETLPWPTDPEDIRKHLAEGKLIEFSIYTELESILSFFSINRIIRVFQSNLYNFNGHKKLKSETEILESDSIFNPKIESLIKKFNSRHALKADFNQCTGAQLIRQLKNVESRYGHLDFDMPFIFIGYSKLFNYWNEITLTPFLKFVKDNPDRYTFATFKEFDSELYVNKLRQMK